MDGHTIYVQRRAKNDFSIDIAIFTKALRTNGPTVGPTDQPIDRPTDIPAYRDAIVASKKGG